jgi:hypothetical protein
MNKSLLFNTISMTVSSMLIMSLTLYDYPYTSLKQYIFDIYNNRYTMLSAIIGANIIGICDYYICKN